MDKYTFYSEQNKKPEKTTRAEACLWSYLNQWKTGYKCVREYVIRPYIADFAFPHVRVIVEADGGYHNTPEKIDYDKRRDSYLQSRGWTVIRLTNEAILGTEDSCIKEILVILDFYAKKMGVDIKYKRGKSPCGRIY